MNELLTAKTIIQQSVDLFVHGWAVTFGTMRKKLGGWAPTHSVFALRNRTKQKLTLHKPVCTDSRVLSLSDCNYSLNPLNQTCIN